LVAVPISLVLSRPNQNPISEKTNTLMVNAHGRLLLLTTKLSAGDTVTLINSQTDEQQPARVVYIGTHQLDKQEIGIEFVKPSPRFWRIVFPPSDWTIEHEDTKGFVKQVTPQPKGLKNL
jgi:hypothetical protein